MKRVAFLLVALLAATTAPVFPARSAPLQSPSASPGRPAAPTSALLIGHVLDAETGDPVPDAVVTLNGRPAPARGRSVGPPAPGNLADLMAAAGGRGNQDRVAADASGRFVFRGLPVSRYSLRAEAPGYLTGYAGPSGLAGGSATFEVRDGQVTAQASVRLWKAAVLTGLVLDEAGEPVIRARVTAFRRTISRLGRVTYTSAQTGSTDDRGEYRLYGLPPGDYLLAVPQSHQTTASAGADALMQSLLSGQMPAGGLGTLGRGASPMDPRGVRVGDWRLTSDNVQAPGVSADGVILAYRTIFHPSATAAAEAASIVLRSGEERAGVDFVLQPVITGRVTGTVTSPAGPAAGVPVRLVPAGEQIAGGFTLPAVAEGQTSADGRFTLLAVPPGDYRLVAEREPRDLPADLPEELASNPMMKMVLEMQRGAARHPIYGEALLSLGGGDQVDVAIDGREGVELRGRLEFRGGPPPAPAAVARATLVLRSVDGQRTTTRTARADAKGQFTVTGVLPGRYAVSSTIGGAAGQWLTGQVSAGGRDATTSPVVVEDKEVEVVVTLTNQVGVLQGTVRRESSVSRTRATSLSPPLTAVIVSANYAEWTNSEMAADQVRLVPVSEDDTFRAGPILSGEYLVAVVDEAQIDLTRGLAALQALAAQATRVTVGPGDPTSVTVGISSGRR